MVCNINIVHLLFKIQNLVFGGLAMGLIFVDGVLLSIMHSNQTKSMILCSEVLHRQSYKVKITL